MEPKQNSPKPSSNLPARRIRHDGWTVERQEAFLKALAVCGCISQAARAVGMSRQSAHDLYNRPSAFAFRRAWDAALDCAIGQVEAGAVERSRYGVARPIFYKGEQVGEYRHFDERLAMFLLRYRRPHRYGSHLDRLPPPPPPRLPPGCEDDGPDPDEAIGALEFHLEDLVDEAELPGGVSQASRANDSVNFVNFVGIRAQERPGDALSTECGAGGANQDGPVVEPDRHPGLEPGSTVASSDPGGQVDAGSSPA